jgi:hypothetical protein
MPQINYGKEMTLHRQIQEESEQDKGRLLPETKSRIRRHLA